MKQYPYFTPQILTDSVFLLYGGQTGTSSVAQRQAAYLLAEEQMTEEIHAFLLPTTVTGTYFWKGGNPVYLDYGWLLNVYSVSIESVDGLNSCQTTSVTGCYAIRGDGQYGAIDISYLLNCSGCGSWVYPPYNIKVAFQSGLSTGTSTQPAVLTALTIAAQINLNEMDVSLSNETTGDAALEFVINQKYHEKRLRGVQTAFGNSALANRAAKLVRKYKARPVARFR